jgi:hypothetical protein
MAHTQDAQPQSSASLAPDDMTKKITALVDAGKYAEAQQLTAGLLIAFPNDERLVKAKALIEKLRAGTPSTSTTPEPGSLAAKAAQPDAMPLTGMDRVNYNALIELMKQAQQTTDLDEQKQLLQQFMVQRTAFLQGFPENQALFEEFKQMNQTSDPEAKSKLRDQCQADTNLIVKKHPEQMLLWKLSAAAAISLNQPREGYAAGHWLLAFGAADSNDPAVQALMGQLKNKDWLTTRGVEVAEEFAWLCSLRPSLTFGPWAFVSFLNTHIKSTVTITVSGLGDFRRPVNLSLENLTPQTCRVDGGAIGTIVVTPQDAVGGIYTTTRTATLLGNRYEVPCTVKASIVSSWGQTAVWATVNNGH